MSHRWCVNIVFRWSAFVYLHGGFVVFTIALNLCQVDTVPSYRVGGHFRWTNILSRFYSVSVLEILWRNYRFKYDEMHSFNWNYGFLCFGTSHLSCQKLFIWNAYYTWICTYLGRLKPTHHLSVTSWWEDKHDINGILDLWVRVDGCVIDVQYILTLRTRALILLSKNCVCFLTFLTFSGYFTN